MVENTGASGDVILIDPLMLHVAARNNGIELRFLLSGGVGTKTMWWPPIQPSLSQRELAMKAMTTLYSLPNATPGWKDWSLFKESFWFPMLRAQRAVLEKEAQRMWAPPAGSR